MPDPHDLARFVAAQEGTIETALDELRRGRKTSHWMWFVFPQIAGLGHSAMARRYAIASLAEAAAYRAHPLLGARLVQATALVNAHRDLTAHRIFGSPDDMKFRSSMTLFRHADPGEALFGEALARFYGGEEDPATLARLGA
ncbi:hypothetical protein GCM10011390_40460 [Aureimonas endophytica]|uniref:Calpastatin n=1 Tax=Aureimonas endophytica TaxID=2027858 RepID=A0A916ZWU9_9HYPH|nr:DUF1810 domain-containing protein [Aureimonas endophytica]GGE17270.1 hypothetical protein GCM10011390_40460 [Aureimonas endophytica]